MNETQLQNIKARYGVVGNDEALNRALDIALKIAPVDLSVLVMGENGAGKEVFPRIIHDHSARKNKKYFAINCGAIPEGTIDSELFGHEKGAFTGAIEQREGYFSVADGGTLFLDEVGELPLATQARLLRVLETGEYIRVGASQVRTTDVRIVAATNVNMEKAIAEGKFREDLYYRLNSVSIHVPPLRERDNDISLLFRKFALEMSEKYKMPAIRLDEMANDLLLHYSWPGNVRQLRNIAENMSVTSEERTITADILSRYLPEEHKNRQIVAVEQKGNTHSFENEREILYKILFELRRDVTDLKKALASGQWHTPSSSHDASHELHPAHSIPLPTPARPIIEPKTEAYYEAEEIKEHDTLSAPRSLDEMEQEVIEKALARYGGKRRPVAEELGISERTLYRKIKEYGLEK